MSRPKFSAYELNALKKLAEDKNFRQQEYYRSVFDFVIRTMDVEEKFLSEKQLKWLWGIKKDCEILTDEGD